MSSVGQNKYYLNTTNVLFDTMEETIGARIAVSLVRAGMSQKDLAAHMNVTTRTVKRWIDNEVDVMEKYRQDLPKVLGVTGDWLFYGTGEPGSTPQTRDVQNDVQAVPPLDLVENDHIKNDKRRVSSAGNPATLEDKILSLVDLDAMKQLVEAGAGDVQEGFFSVFRRMHDGDVYKFTVRVEVELERGQNTRMTKPQTKGPPDSDANE